MEDVEIKNKDLRGVDLEVDKSEPPKKHKKRINIKWVLLGLGLILLAGAGVVAGYWLSPSEEKNDDAGVVEPEQDQSMVVEGITELLEDKTITDEDMGYDVLIKRVLVGVPFDEKYSVFANRFIGMAVEVKLDNYSSYISTLAASRMSLWADGKRTYAGGAVMKEYLDKYGLKALEDVNKDENKQGWMLFYVPKDYGSLEFVYARPETTIKVIEGEGENTVLPAKDFRITL